MNEYFRSRNCRLLCSDSSAPLCEPCQDVLTNLEVSCEDKQLSPSPHRTEVFDKNEEEEVEVKDSLPLEIKILKEEPLDEYPGTSPLGEARRKKDVKKEPRKKVVHNNFPCPQCPNTFQSQLKMVRHASKKHGLYLPMPLGPGLTRCPFCVEIFNEASVLHSHWSRGS